MKPNPEQSAFIERVGRWWEQLSGSRSAGQILGWLMICEPAHQSSSDLAKALQISTGSVSTQARLLEAVGLLERITFPGDRATYYQLKPNVWRELMWSEQQRIEEMRGLARAAEPLTPDMRPDRVEELNLIADFFLARWPDLMSELADHLEKESGK